ncbi:MAG: sugar ABC transporter substrate-binding protein [Propionibacteriaceae bacterium]|jgi:multiple sugar transport system substrate-binding protein|nr:sugar ABC transporter substrate-binding protein [Propionibacteriaceae bacterium]
MKNMKAAVAGVLGVALLLTGCGGNTSGGGGTDANGKTTIVFDMWAGSQDDTDAINKQVEIAKKVTGIEIEVRTAPWNDYFTKLTTNMASGNVACVTGMNSGMLSSYVDAFAELTDEDLATAGIVKDEFADGSLEILSNKGKLYGIPFDVSTMLVYYNKDMLDAAGATEPKAGWTFDDFLATAKKATTGDKYGFGIALGEFQWQALPISKSGVQPASKEGVLQLTDPAFVEAATWYSDLVTKEKVAAPVSSASDTGWGENQYSSGAAAMAVDGTWNAVGYLNNDLGFTAGMAPLPVGADGSLGLVLGSGYGISKTCENKEAALKVLGGLLNAEAQDYIASSGRSYPARTASQPKYFESLDEKYREPVKAAFEEAFKNVQGQYVTDNWSKVGTFLQPQLVSVYSGQTSMADILAEAQKQFGE